MYFLTVLGGCKSKIKALTWLDFPKASLLGLQKGSFLLCPHMAFSLCAHIPAVLSSSYKNISHIGLGPCSMTSFMLNFLFKGIVSKYSHTGG